MAEHFFKKFQNNDAQGSFLYAKGIAETIQDILELKLKDVEGIDKSLETIQKLRTEITQYKPTEFSIGNVIKRITSIIREQARAQGIFIAEELENEKQENKFISKLFSFRAIHRPEEESPSHVKQNALVKFKTEVMEAVASVINEFENLSSAINESASRHINNNEIILVFGSSYTIRELLIEAKKKKTFEVIVVENSLSKNGHEMAKKLAEAQIKTTLIPDTAIYAVMHRVHKAFISAHSIMANGGILGTSGCLLVALACKAHLVPMIVVGGIYKLTPKIPFEQDTYNDVVNPGAVYVPTSKEKMENIEVIVPAFDYIAPEYVTLYITNVGEHTPTYIYRVFGEYYSNN